MAWTCRDSRSAGKLRPLIVALAAILCVVSTSAQTVLRVAAAADLQPVLPPILAQFQQQTGIRAEATYQASAALTMQIQNGAPFDIFLSADMSYPQRLADAGLTVAPPVPYAQGTLVLWTRRDTHLPPPSLDLLRDPRLKRLAIANPDRAPYGRAAVAALRSLDLYDALQPRFANAENISQAAQFADTANADAGLISMTSALTPRLAADGSFFVLPRSLYPPIQQGAAILKNSRELAAAQRLLAFLLSAPVQSQLARSGLAPAGK
jgi:molybdate transport system substrate-binding protein